MNFQPFYSSSEGNLYRLTDGDSSILLECGVPMAKIKQALGFKLHDVSACLISHGHL